MFKGLFGSGSDKPKSVRLGVNAYGKLPIYKDFISCGMTDAPAREFRVWIDKGFSHRWSTDEATAGAEIPPYSFLMRLPDSRGCTAGSLWGSADEGGLRKFPFALFLSFPKDHGAADPVAAIEYLGDIERRASELRFLFGPGASLSSFYQTYRGNEIDVLLRPRTDVSRELHAELADFSIAEFAESLFGDASVSLWPRLLESAKSLVVSGQASVLRLPLSGRLPRAREVEFWLFWLERLDPKGKRPLMGVLYPHGHNPGRVVFFFRELKPEDFLLLHPTRSDLPSVGDAVAGVPGAAEALSGAKRRGARATPAPPVVESEKASEASPDAEAAPVPEPAPASMSAAAVSPAPEPTAEAAPLETEPAAPMEAAQPVRSVEPEPEAVQPAPSQPESPSAAPETPSVQPEPAPPSSEPEPERPSAEPAAVSPVDAASVAPAEIASDASPFPEADAPPETTSGARLSGILALDPEGRGGVTEEAAAAAAVAAVEPPADPGTAAGAGPAAEESPAAAVALDSPPAASEPEPPPARPVEAPSDVPPASETRFLEEPEFELPDPPEAEIPEAVSASPKAEDPPLPPSPVRPSRPESVSAPPEPLAPVAPVAPTTTPTPPPTPTPERPAPPAAWSRPLPTLLDE